MYKSSRHSVLCGFPHHTCLTLSPGFDASMNRNALSCVNSAAAIGTGLKEISLPRMLYNQATCAQHQSRDDDMGWTRTGMSSASRCVVCLVADFDYDWLPCCRATTTPVGAVGNRKAPGRHTQPAHDLTRGWSSPLTTNTNTISTTIIHLRVTISRDLPKNCRRPLEPWRSRFIAFFFFLFLLPYRNR